MFLTTAGEEDLDPRASLLPASEVEATKLLLNAIERLEKDHSLLSGDPEGFFTYEDPILAVAIRACQINEEEIASAGQPGEDLRNNSIFSWARVGVNAFLSRLDRSIQELAGTYQKEHRRVEQGSQAVSVSGDLPRRDHTQAWLIGRTLEPVFINHFLSRSQSY